MLRKLCDFLAIKYDGRKLVKANTSSKSILKDCQLNSELINDLLEIFSDDLAKLDSLLGSSTLSWLDRYR
jgi:hypothetical protein